MCDICLRSFTTKNGLGLHRKRAHPAAYNEEVKIAQRKPRWTDEEIEMLALEEAKAPPNTRNMNSYLLGRMDGVRSLESIKGIRKKERYRALVIEHRERLLAGAMDATLGPSVEVRLPERPDVLTAEQLGSIGGRNLAMEWLLKKYDDIIPEIKGGIWIRTAVCRLRDGLCPDESLEQWWAAMFPDLPVSESRRVSSGVRSVPEMSKRKARRREYRRMQSLWRTNMTKAAKKILDGDADELPHPTLEEQTSYWRPMIEAATGGDLLPDAVRRRPALEDVWAPITEGETINIKLPLASAPGLDGMTVKRWLTEVPAIIRAAIFNIIMATGVVPSRFRDSRTVFIPKSTERRDPGFYRPISIASVVLRHFHKILALRLSRCNLVDERQRAFISTDGCAENVAVLSALLMDARTCRKQVHVLSLDVQKAFDTVAHAGIYKVLRKYGIPSAMVEYLRELYATATTRLQVDGQYSQAILPGRGVRQGDPLSPLVFNLVINEVLAEISDEVGYRYLGHTINVLAFADDLIVVGSTARGAQASLDNVVRVLESFGMRLSPAKCAAFSLMPAGKEKKIKILTEDVFRVGGQVIPQKGVLQTMRYLGVQFDSSGPTQSRVQLAEMLGKLRRAPLKPQQRIKILKTYLLPRYIHCLVLGRTSHGALRKMDVLVRAAVRQWLRLPKDVTKAFFHAPVDKGGLGIMALESAIPEMTGARLDRLRASNYRIASVVGCSEWAARKRSWCRMALRRSEDWHKELYQSTDGLELREAWKVKASTNWLTDPMVRVPPGDWINYVRVWIGALPSRVRTTRGVRRAHQDVLCRGGCGVDETTAHIVQQCFRTHGGRVMRHDAIAAVLAAELDRAGYRVRREHLFQTQQGGRKPDILAVKGEQGFVLDVQVVSGARSLNEAHTLKTRYYESNNQLMDSISALLQVNRQKIRVSSVTLSWRGVWAVQSAGILSEMGLSKALLNGMTTRVLMGSYLNFTRFNQTTLMHRGRAFARMSGWGPPPQH